MDGLNAAAEGILVHNVVMDQGESMGEFKSKGCRKDIIRTSPVYCIRCEHDNRWAKPFSSGSEKVGRSFVQLAGSIDKIPVYHVIDLLCDEFHIGKKLRHRMIPLYVILSR
jgi:hypothetical protein